MKKKVPGDKGIEPCPIQSHSPLATYPTEIKNRVRLQVKVS